MQSSHFKQRVFSGVQPTGALHLGNYLGAIRNFVRLQETYECIYCVVDLHAITVWQPPATLAEKTRHIAATYLAAGIDPQSSIIFNQSAVPQHSELAWIFNCVARVGWLNRMTQFKDKAGKNQERASIGLYAYPVLMAADILAYKATHVPVGEDQKQHLELTRDIAQKFNLDFDRNVFPVTEPIIQGSATRVMSLRDGSKKMSKSELSDMSRINLEDNADVIAQKIRKAKTDPEPLPGLESLDESGAATPNLRASRPEAVNLLGIYAALNAQSFQKTVEQFSGQSFAVFKRELTDLAISTLAPLSTKMQQLLDNKDEIDHILAQGAERAQAIAEPVLKEVYETVGLLRP